MDTELQGKAALVTGASRGIGRDAAIALARLGINVAVGYRENRAAADAVKAEIEALGRLCVLVQGNVADGDDVKRIVKEAERGLGGIDVLINNAGVARARDMSTLTEADWHEAISTNLTSAFLVTHAALPSMRARGWGRIINLSSVAAQIGGVVGPHYAASKAGMIGLTHGYASWLAKENITVNAITPALIETDMIKELPRARAAMMPVGRFGLVEEVTSVITMLVSNGYITGQTIGVNGGLYFS